MRNLIMMLLMTLCLSARCTSINTNIVCAQIKKHQIVPVKNCDISFEFNRCRCRCFDYNSWDRLDLASCPDFAGLEGNRAIDLDIKECEGISGFLLEDAATKIRPNIKALHVLKGNLCE